MKLDQLTTIVKNVQKNLRCPKCGSHFVKQNVEIVDLSGDRGLFSAHCMKCNSSLLTALSVRDLRQRLESKTRQVEKVLFQKILPSDVVGMKKFLDSFDGNFEKMLCEKKAKNNRMKNTE
jgi:hypothetical protein